MDFECGIDDSLDELGWSNMRERHLRAMNTYQLAYQRHYKTNIKENSIKKNCINKQTTDYLLYTFLIMLLCWGSCVLCSVNGIYINKCYILYLLKIF